MKPAIHISGADPAGLVAAITITKEGGRAVVHERNEDVGMRFHGDFISSCFVHVCKPDRDIFRRALDIAQVPAEELIL